MAVTSRSSRPASRRSSRNVSKLVSTSRTPRARAAGSSDRSRPASRSRPSRCPNSARRSARWRATRSRGFETFRADADATPIFRGLPDDRCQSPHWGYVLRGRLTLRYADHEEVYAEGDAYYAPPGHVPVVTAGTEVVEFSPTEEVARTTEVVARNLAEASPPA